MAHILITFLGRVDPNGGSYRLTRYDFNDGIEETATAFFGWNLQRRLRPDCLVILGTSGSMWDHLFEGDLAFGDAGEQAREALIGAVGARDVRPLHVTPLEPLLAERLGCQVRLVVIPYCRDADEQVQLLDIIAGQVAEGDRVDLDVTHGFRHLPMLALLAALQLRSLRKATISGIWYGAYDHESGTAPVHNLAGLLHIAGWLQALHTYDKDGDYGVFAPLLGESGRLLQQAAFFERTSNSVKAQEKLHSWANAPERFPPNDPAARLFGPELEQRVSWYRKAQRSEREAMLARLYLDRGDFVRAAIYAQESRITAEVSRVKGDMKRREEREEARFRLLEDGPFRDLGDLRNALAHGHVKEDKQRGRKPGVQPLSKLISDETALRATLKRLFQELGL